jgi:high-affinity iron transporter
MFASAVIVFREVLEAALVLGIVLAASRDIAASRRWITGGVAAGVAGAVLLAACAASIATAFAGIGEELLNASILLLAVAMLAWHAVWMQRHGGDIARNMRAVGHDVGAGTRPLHALAIVVALAVLREGSEVVLFLYGIAAGGTAGTSLWAGAATGLVLGATAGALLYLGLLRIPARHLFSVTGWMLVLLAAGMAGQAAACLVQAGALPGLVEPVWNSSSWLPLHSLPGQVLHVLAGYADRPSLMQLLFFVATLAGIVGLGRLVNRSDWRRRVNPLTSATSLLVAIALTTHAPRAHAAHVVYSPLVEQGERAIEWRGHYILDGNDATDGEQQAELEFEWSPMARWRTELLVAAERASGDGLETTGIASENVFQLTEQGRYWADFGLLAEYAHSLEHGGSDAVELGLLAQKDAGRHETRLNLTFERPLTGSGDTRMGYAWQYRYRLRESFEPGIEMYGGLGEVGNIGALDNHEQQIGPAFAGKLRTTKGALKYEAGLLFGLNDQTPDATARFLLEYEF